MDEIITKKCSKCGETKPLTEYCHPPSCKGRYFNSCKECERKKNLAWREKNREKSRASGRRHYYKHREECIKRVKEWTDNHKETYNNHIKDWHDRHYEEGVMSRRKYRATHKAELKEDLRRKRTLMSEGDLTKSEWQSILDKYGRRCLCCGRSDVEITMDHIVPLEIGGPHTAENVQPLCRSCNSSKKQKTTDYRPDHQTISICEI